MAGYPINVSSLIYANISLVAHQENTSMPFSCTVTEYLLDDKVDLRLLIKPTRPFDMYSLKDTKNKKSTQPELAPGQSKEPGVPSVTSDMPSSSIAPTDIIIDTESAAPPPSFAQAARPSPSPSVTGPLSLWGISGALV